MGTYRKPNDEPGCIAPRHKTPETELGDPNKRFQNKLIPQEHSAVITIPSLEGRQKPVKADSVPSLVGPVAHKWGIACITKCCGDV
jgi:hypothetical protein